MRICVDLKIKLTSKMRDYLKNKLGVPENWDKHDYQTQRYSFEDIEEILQTYKNEQLRIGGVGNWVTFEETNPTESERYLIKENEAVYIAEYSKEDDFWYDEDFNKIYNVDYWMNLPE